MNYTLNEKSDRIKDSINVTAEKSKETIREMISSNNKYIGDALDSNRIIVDSIKEKLNNQDIEDSVTESMNSTFGKSIELAEDALDSIINAYTKQMEMTVDFNTKLVDVIKSANLLHPEEVLELIHGNFHDAHQLTIKNTKEILDFYNKHTSLAVSFNQKFCKSINAQIESLFILQNKGLNKFTIWAADWWKQEEEDKKEIAKS